MIFLTSREVWALYGVKSEKRVEFVARNVDVFQGLSEKVAAFGSTYSFEVASVDAALPKAAIFLVSLKFVTDRQYVILELGVFPEPDGFVGFLRHFVVAAGGNAHAHGIGFLGHFLRGADQVVGH